MKKITLRIIYLLTAIMIASCASSIKKNIDYKDVNVEYNDEVKNNMKHYEGTLSKNEHAALIKKLKIELQTEIPPHKSILINYYQKASNCTDIDRGKKRLERVVDSLIDITKEITSNTDALNFMVYSEEAFYKDIYERKPEYQLDSGFFHDYIFTEHELCQAFFILKPNGKFYKGYRGYYNYPIKALLEKDEDL